MKTRETNKKAYISNYKEMFKQEMAGTFWTENEQEKRIEVFAQTGWLKRKEEIENKADALMYGILDAKAYSNKIREEVKRELN